MSNNIIDKELFLSLKELCPDLAKSYAAKCIALAGTEEESEKRSISHTTNFNADCGVQTVKIACTEIYGKEGRKTASNKGSGNANSNTASSNEPAPPPTPPPPPAPASATSADVTPHVTITPPASNAHVDGVDTTPPAPVAPPSIQPPNAGGAVSSGNIDLNL